MENFVASIRRPLNLYSVFGYLMPGFFLTTLLIIDYDVSSILRLKDQDVAISVETIRCLDLKMHYVLELFATGTLDDFKFIPFLIFLFFCYLLGHLISAFSSFLLERIYVQYFLIFPSKGLLTPRDPGFIAKKWWKQWPWKSIRQWYARPFDKSFIDKIDKTVEEKFGGRTPRNQYYWLIYAYLITARPYLAPRIHHFVNLYGFSRNICGSFIIYIIFRISFLWWYSVGLLDSYVFTILFYFALAAGVMFWNYLKLFKRQAVDMYCLFVAVDSDQENPMFGG